MAKEKRKNFTIKTDVVVLAEFYAAVDLLRGRNASDYIHNFMVQTIAQAKKQVTVQEFQQLVEEKQKKTQENSELRKKKPRNPASKPSDAKRPPRSATKAA